MRILVTGAGGFIGSMVSSALSNAGHHVVRGVHGVPDNDDETGCDFSRDTGADTWIPRLQNIDAVINCAGILREHGRSTFDNVHVQTPIALYQACMATGVNKIIQLSALGNDSDGEFIRSKYRGDAFLEQLDIDWVILRPSVVYSSRGSYGGTSLLRALAALPWIVFVPGAGNQQLQPVCSDDLVLLITKLLEPNSPSRETIEVAGDSPITITQYLLRWRAWLGLRRPRVFPVPLWLVKPVTVIGEHLGNGPLGTTMYTMLQHGNVASPGAAGRFEAITGHLPRSLDAVLDSRAACVQDRWHAQLYFIGPILRVLLAFVWIVSGIVGFTTPAEAAKPAFLNSGLPAELAASTIFLASGYDIVAGVLVLIDRYTGLAGALMLFGLVIYTLFIGICLPEAWLEPFGGLIKNLPLIPAVITMMVLSKRR